MNEIMVKDNKKIENMIHEIRGKQVILDKDLAYLYETETRKINQAVKRNKERFPEEFCFQLTSKEMNNLYSRSQFVILNNGKRKQGTNIKYLPYAFTEQGVAMLSALLKTDVAIKQSIIIMNAFVAMRRFLSSELLEQRYINNKVFELDERVNLLENAFNTKTFSNEIFFEGQIYDAYSLLLDIFNSSKDSIIIIDNYADKNLFDILSKTNKDVTVYSKNIDNNLINKYKEQYNNVTLINNNSFHDRFIIIDKKVLYHCGSSFKDLGKKCFGINRIDNTLMVNDILSKL